MLRGIILSTIFLSTALIAQENSDTKDRNFRFEFEPASFALKGFSGGLMYNVTKDNALSVGLYTASIDVPAWSRNGMFENVGGDTSKVRLGFELALNVRYKFKLFPEYESNPYVGLIAGWEYFDVTQPSTVGSVRLSTYLATIYTGYEIYFFKQMLYINPQFRGVFYFGSSTSDSTRPEKIGKFLPLPQIALGIRF